MSARGLTVYPCPLCGARVEGQEAYVEHLLRERGEAGVTTAQFVQWGAGTRAAGGRIYDLRQRGVEEGFEIISTAIGRGKWHYQLVVLEGGGDRALSSSPGPAVLEGADRLQPDGYLCLTCGREPADGVCKPGHRVGPCVTLDFRQSAVAHGQTVIQEEIAA